ncbi:MAG: 2-keto-4-pentenoate hydratase [Gammaproteobacteria bacterium]|nr:2-keto-4-pentenoate hydratase [Gammaproteobacteria bacterium]
MIDTAKVAIAAELLRDAYHKGPVGKVSSLFCEHTPELGYAIQEHNSKHWIECGRKLVGRKIGLTSEAVQKQMQVDQPDFGLLFSDMMVDDSSTVPIDSLWQPKIEAEIAFLLKRDLLAKDISLEDVLDAIDAAAPALEIVDSRIADWDISLVDTIADNASSGLFVVGPARKPVSAFDRLSCKMLLWGDSTLCSTGSGQACLGDPIAAVMWLAKKMIEVGRPLHAGDWVLSGALGPMIAVKTNISYRAEIEGLGSASLKFC